MLTLTPAFNDVNSIDSIEDEAAEAATERAHSFTLFDPDND
jgi:hypothetical protein